MTLFDWAKSVRCKKCRENLFSVDEYPLIDCHKKLLSINKHISVTNSDEACDSSNDEISCETQRDNSMIFLNEESYPLFIGNAINEGLWQKGKLYCPKCKTRIGTFNFVNALHCSCQSSLLPAVHLHISKVDYILPSEQINPVLSMPHSSTASTSGEDYSAISNDPVVNLGATHINYSFDKDVPDDEKVALMKQTAKASEKSDLEVQVRGIIDKNSDQYLDQNNLNEHTEDQTLIGVQLSQVSYDKIKLEDKSTPHRSEGNLRRRKSWKKSESSASSILTFANHELPNNDEDKEETHSPSLCDSSEDLSQPSTFHVLDNIPENFSEAKEVEITSDEKFTAVFPDNLICAVCLDLLYSPFVVKPCSHIFCEPCLRRLAKPSPTNTSCPLCRELIGLCNPCHEISREIKENFPEHNKERHKFEQLHESRHMPLPWLRDYRFLGFRGRFRQGNYGRNWTGWRTILWIFILDCLGLSLVLAIKWILGDYEANLQQIEIQSKQRTLDTPSSLELESSYPSSQEFLDISNDSFFETIVE